MKISKICFSVAVLFLLNVNAFALTVNTNDIADGAVTSPKIADGAVTSTKISSGAVTSQHLGMVCPDGQYLQYTTSSGWICSVGTPGPTGPQGPEGPQGPAGPASQYENVVVVAKSGGDFTSIQAAIDSLPGPPYAPYTINVMPGTYDEVIRINRSNTTVRGVGGSGVTTITNPVPSIYSPGISDGYGIGTSNVTLEGFTISGAGGGISVGNYNMGICSDNLKILNNKIINSGGINIFCSNNALIKGNTLANCSYGIATYGSQIVVSDNVIKNGSYFGIYPGGVQTQVVHNVITGNAPDLFSAAVSTANISFNVLNTITCNTNCTGFNGSYNVTSAGAPVTLP